MEEIRLESKHREMLEEVQSIDDGIMNIIDDIERIKEELKILDKKASILAVKAIDRSRKEVVIDALLPVNLKFMYDSVSAYLDSFRRAINEDFSIDALERAKTSSNAGRVMIETMLEDYVRAQEEMLVDIEDEQYEEEHPEESNGELPDGVESIE